MSLFKPSQEMDELRMLNGDGVALYPVTPSISPVSLSIEPSSVNWQLFETQTVTFPAVPITGTFKITYGGNESGALNYNDSAATIQTAARLVSGLSAVVVSGSFVAGFTFYMSGVDGDAGAITITSNTLKSVGVIEVQQLTTPSVPTSGQVTLTYGGGTAVLAYDTDAASLQVLLRLVEGLSAVTVAGNFTAGFSITFTGVDGDASMITLSSNSLDDGAPVTPSMAEITKGVAMPAVTPVVTETTKGAT